MNKFHHCPLNHEKPALGETIYYNFKISSNAYKEYNQDLWGYVNTIYNGDYVVSQTEKWISEKHPDFIWAKYPLNKPWNGPCKINPEINAKIVYDIYKKSISNEEILFLNLKN